MDEVEKIDKVDKVDKDKVDKSRNKDPHSWNWTGNLILKLVCFLQLFDLSTPSVV